MVEFISFSLEARWRLWDNWVLERYAQQKAVRQYKFEIPPPISVKMLMKCRGKYYL